MTVFDTFRRILKKHKDIIPIVAVAEMLADIDEAEEKWNDGWIPFTQREMTEEEKESFGEECGYILDCPLPEEDEEILVTHKFKDELYVDMDIFLRDGSECYLDSGHEFVSEAIAWRRKPAPYQK